MYSVDYPFEENEERLNFMEDLKESGLVNEEQFKAIAYENAAKLLKINTPAVQGDTTLLTSPDCL